VEPDSGHDDGHGRSYNHGHPCRDDSCHRDYRSYFGHASTLSSFLSSYGIAVMLL
jgi:hypothetical protein